MLKLMGKKTFTILYSKFCLSKHVICMLKDKGSDQRLESKFYGKNLLTYGRATGLLIVVLHHIQLLNVQNYYLTFQV